MYNVNVAGSWVDFVLPKLFPCINIVLKLLQDRKWKKSHNMGVYEKEFWGYYLGVPYL